MRKKEAKKKAAGKKGSVYEEEYLLNTLVKVSNEKLSSLQSASLTILSPPVKCSSEEKLLIIFGSLTLSTSMLLCCSDTAGSLLPALIQLMSFSPSAAPALLETGRKVQDKLGLFQADLATKVQTVWDQREPKEDAVADGADDAPPAVAIQISSLATLVPRPLVSTSSDWKLTLI
jgi:elongator complex protein 1